MLSKEQYNEVVVHKIVLKHVHDGGNAPAMPLERFNQILSENNLPQHDLFCNECKIELAKDMYNLLIEYENGR